MRSRPGWPIAGRKVRIIVPQRWENRVSRWSHGTAAARNAYPERMTGYLSDLLHAVRTLTRARAFTAVCVVSLGLGMGVVIAILLLLRMVFATPPGVKTDRLVELVIRPTGRLLAQAGNDVIDKFSYPDYLDVRDAANGMVVTGWSGGDGLVRPAEQGPAMPVSTMYVSSNYFSNLGVALVRGAGFTPVNDASRAEPEAVIG